MNASNRSSLQVCKNIFLLSMAVLRTDILRHADTKSITTAFRSCHRWSSRGRTVSIISIELIQHGMPAKWLAQYLTGVPIDMATDSK